jgi:hypothetical protein
MKTAQFIHVRSAVHEYLREGMTLGIIAQLMRHATVSRLSLQPCNKTFPATHSTKLPVTVEIQKREHKYVERTAATGAGHRRSWSASGLAGVTVRSTASQSPTDV